MAPASGTAGDSPMCTWSPGSFSSLFSLGGLGGKSVIPVEKAHFSYLAFGLFSGTPWRNRSFLSIMILVTVSENSLTMTSFPLEGEVTRWSQGRDVRSKGHKRLALTLVPRFIWAIFGQE